jgi:hypothetical protein
MTPMEIGISSASSSGAESGGPFDFYAPIVFAPSTFGSTSQSNDPNVTPSATATTALPGGTAVGYSGGTSPNPASNTAASPTQLLSSGSSSWMIYAGLALAAAIGVYFIFKK